MLGVGCFQGPVDYVMTWLRKVVHAQTTTALWLAGPQAGDYEPWGEGSWVHRRGEATRAPVVRPPRDG